MPEMPNNPRLSVLLTFKNQREEAENTLTAVLELEDIDIELVVLDDGSTDGTRDVIHSLLDHYQHENTYFFDHDGTHGRGNLLNEGLSALDGPYLWMPESVEEIDEEHLFRVLKALSKSDKTGLLQRPNMIPETVDEWVEYLDKNPLPRDSVYLWNLDQIPPRERFFTPYLINHHGTELAARVLSRSNAGLIDPFFTVRTHREQIQPDITVVSEFVFTLLRRPGLTSRQKDFLLNLLNPSVSEEMTEQLEAGDEELFQKALRYYRAGNISASLEFVNSLLEQTPNHLKARKLKIEILEKLRRYVEAAELKHEMRSGEDKRPMTEQAEPDKPEQDEEEEWSLDEEEPDAEEELPEVEEEVEPEQTESPEEEETTSKEDKEVESEEMQRDPGQDELEEMESRSLSEEETDEAAEDSEEFAEEDEELESSEDEDLELEEETTSTNDFPDPPHPEIDEVITSIIVPTMGDGKPALEQLMVSLSEYVDPRQNELIVVDNASLDDTHDYLEQLEKDNYFNCKIITNHQNQGFARSVNAALKKAEGQYACIVHNDVSLTQGALDRMVGVMEEHEDFAILGPSADQTINPRQRAENLSDDEEIVEVDYLDSFCMLLRMSTNLLMDEQFGLAYFEDVDLCFQARDKNYKVGVLPSVSVEHFHGVTTSGMGLDLDSGQYWYNAAAFNEKWGLEPSFPEDMEEKEELEQLLILNERVNPFYPEEDFKSYFDSLLTDELKTQLLKLDLEKDVLLELVDLMLTMDRRDILRKLEDKVEEFELPPALLYRLIRYYYERNIFSRCKHYLGQLPESEQSPHTRLVELKIAVAEKDMDEAIPMLSELMNKLPAHPELYRQAARIHKFEGNNDEAESFNEIAAQLDPFNYAGDGVGTKE